MFTSRSHQGQIGGKKHTSILMKIGTVNNISDNANDSF